MRDLWPEWWSKDIRMRRLVAGLSQEELAAELHVSRRTIGLIERRRSVPSVTLAIAIARRLETTVEELFSVEPLR